MEERSLLLLNEDLNDKSERLEKLEAEIDTISVEDKAEIKILKADIKSLKKEIKLKEKEEKDAQKEKEKALMAIPKFFADVYSNFSSLQVSKEIDKVYFQSFVDKDQTKLGIFYNRLSYCMVYGIIKGDYKQTTLIDWIMFKPSTITLSIETIDLLRHMKAKPSKSKKGDTESNVPIELNVTEDKIELIYGHYKNETLVETNTIIINRGTKDCYAIIQNYLKNSSQFILDAIDITNDIFATDVLKLYLTSDNKIQRDVTDEKIIEMNTKDILVNLKGENCRYTLGMTKPGANGLKNVFLTGSNEYGALLQILKTI